MIAFDQRGTGISGEDELDCEERYQYPLDKPGGTARLSCTPTGCGFFICRVPVAEAG